MKFTYLVAHHEEKGLASPKTNIKAYFKNPVSKGDFVFWEMDAGRISGSYGGRVIDIEHTPDFSVIRIDPK